MSKHFHPFTLKGNLEILASGVLIAFTGISICRSLTFGFGERGTSVEQEFKRDGKHVQLMHVDIKLGPDRYFLQMEDGSKAYVGTFKMDDGREVTVTDFPLVYCSKPKIK
ncbi:hypothetical protein KY308_03065 [Candidatus Woesearchaeota archaeon]|nr:hypothetical protein [Candidatus Woesearchaeota archaeon]